MAKRWIDRQRFQVAVVKSGLSQTDVFRKAGLDPNKMATRLSRGNSWDDQELERVAAILGMSPSRLVDGEQATLKERAKKAVKDFRAQVVGALHADSPQVLGSPEIAKRYAVMGEGDFAWIFSADGFLEARDPEFYEIVSGAISSGVRISYFFPQDDESTASRSDFETVCRKLRNEFGDGVGDAVRAFYLRDRGSLLYAERARFVVFGKTDAGRTFDVEAVYLYISSGGDFWVTIPNAKKFAMLVRSATDPIEYVPQELRLGGSLPSRVKTQYQTAFVQIDSPISYGKIRDLFETKTGAMACANSIARHFDPIKSQKGEVPFLTWLDIGCEDGTNTSLMADELRRRGLQASLVAIDTSTQRPADRNAILNASVFLNDTEWSFEKFCYRVPRQIKFDVITSIHSWYCIDPRRLVHAYRRLSDSGILCVLIAPLANNAINSIVRLVDHRIATQFGDNASPYRGKVIVDDPYRNYAEDLLKVASAIFGTGVCTVERLNRTVRRNTLLTNADELTEVGRQIVRFFTHKLITVDDALLVAVASELRKLQPDADLQNEEWLLTISKPSVLARGLSVF